MRLSRFPVLPSVVLSPSFSLSILNLLCENVAVFTSVSDLANTDLPFFFSGGNISRSVSNYVQRFAEQEVDNGE